MEEREVWVAGYIRDGVFVEAFDDEFKDRDTAEEWARDDMPYARYWNPGAALVPAVRQRVIQDYDPEVLDES